MSEEKEEVAEQCCDVRMESAENGVIICYSVKEKTLGGGTYDYSYNYKKEVFPIPDGDKKAMVSAMERFLALTKKAGS